MPIYLREVAIVRALELVVAYLTERGDAAAELKRIEVSAGDSVVSGRLHAWFSRGDWIFQSAAASRLAAICCQVASILPCPLYLYSFHKGKPAGGRSPADLEVGWTAIEGGDKRKANGWLGGSSAASAADD